MDAGTLTLATIIKEWWHVLSGALVFFGFLIGRIYAAIKGIIARAIERRHPTREEMALCKTDLAEALLAHEKREFANEQQAHNHILSRVDAVDEKLDNVFDKLDKVNQNIIDNLRHFIK